MLSLSLIRVPLEHRPRRDDLAPRASRRGPVRDHVSPLLASKALQWRTAEGLCFLLLSVLAIMPETVIAKAGFILPHCSQPDRGLYSLHNDNAWPIAGIYFILAM